MINKQKYSYEEKNTWIVHEIANDDLSKAILEKYYKSIAKNSRNTYASHIRKICQKTGKSTFASLNYTDYLKVRTAQHAFYHYESFFKFLYAFNYLNDENGFEAQYWSKDRIKKEYEEKVLKNNNLRTHLDESNSEPVITLVELDKLLNFYNNVAIKDIPNMKIAFCFYGLFFLGMSSGEIQKLSKSQIESGCIVTEEGEYIINEKFWMFLSNLPESEYTFGQINTYVSKLCKTINIKKLTPVNLKTAHKQYTFNCPQCGESYLSFSNNWQVINNQILCNDCAKILIDKFQLKKNLIFNEFNSTDIETISPVELENTMIMLTDFSNMKKQFTEIKNYQEINMFLKSIGDLGEKYVVEYEQLRLKKSNSPYWELVDGSYALDNHNGFDILSYTESGKKLYIEVKTTTGDPSESFYLTKNEYDTAYEIINRGDYYRLYRVGNILTDNVSLVIYDTLDKISLDSIVYKASFKE